MSTHQPFKSPDVTGNDLVKELLFYFRGFRIINKTEDQIKQKCHIEQDKKVWSLVEIKQAWEKAKKKKERKKKWSCVILLQELKRRVRNDNICKRRIPKEDDDDLEGPRKSHTSDRLLESNSDMNIVCDDASQAADDLQKALTIKEKIGEDLSQQPCHILIPLSAISENESTTIPDVDDIIPYTPYKLKDGVPYRKINPSGNEIRKRKSYVMSFNDQTNNADWTYEILNKSTLANNTIELNLNNINYEKGHLAAAANHRWCLEAKNDASLFSNITPQHEILNGGVWRALENECRTRALETRGNVHVYTGPLYLNRRELRVGGKALPSHLFKVMIVEDDDGIAKNLECYMMPNATIAQSCTFRDNEFKKTIGYIEEKSGLIFVEPTTTTRNSIKTITLQGKDADEQFRNANIKVRISS